MRPFWNHPSIMKHEAAARRADKLAVTASLAVVTRGEHCSDAIGMGHRVGKARRALLLSDPRAGRRIADRNPRPVDPFRVRWLDDLKPPSGVGIRPVRSMMVADGLAVPVDLAEIDVN